MRQMLDRVHEPLSRFFPQRAVDTLYFTHTCDLWRPAPITHDANKVASDPVFQLAAAGQKCLFVGTLETDEPSVIGRTKTVNIFTLDVWHFPVGTPVEDNWFLKLTSSTGVDNDGKGWMTQGNPEALEGFAYHPVGVQVVLTKLSPFPKGVT